MITDNYRNLVRWQTEHNSRGLDLIRIFLGGALFVRGILFLMDPSMIVELAGSGIQGVTGLVTWAHLIGGGLMVLGLFTRLAALIQLPILANAVFLVHMDAGFAEPNQSLELSALVLVLLATFVVFGSGKWSLDYQVFKRIDA